MEDRKSRPNEVVTVEGINFEIRPKWQSTEDSIDKYKLTPEKQLEKKLQRVSDNYKKASLEYREYLRSLRTDDVLFRNLCRSVSPLKSNRKDKGRDNNKRTRSLGRRSSTAGVDLENNVKEELVEKQHVLIKRQSHSVPPINRKKEGTHRMIKYDKEDDFGEESSKKIDIYLTNLTLNDSIERYAKRLYSICKMLDSEFSEDGEGYDYDFFDSDYDIEAVDNKRTVREGSTLPNARVRNSINESSNDTNERLNCSQIQQKQQPQTIIETLNETVSKWSRRLRKDNSTENYSGGGGNENKENPITRVSKATRARMSLKEVASKLNFADEEEVSKFLSERGRSETRKKSSIGQETGYYDKGTNKNDSFANVIVTSESVSKQPFISLFNVQS
ncbi:hypothetical protein FG386_001754 [Cryptosporidium ryanae]|uniref:uncharacterized protein n=1 Tax=Cryptosporidium ryanae TaxID=515981 RepID=UPI00351A6E71|nr:hypothetical protein FG386_001754 [Cryptosporidium ryanae]